MAYPIKTAHYTAAKDKYVVIVEAGQEYSKGKCIQVTGKVDARKVAKDHDAKPWNF